MFEVGFSEILVIMAIALVVLGPEKLPRLAIQIGRWVGRAKAMARQFREQLEEEASKLDVVKDLKKDLDLTKEFDRSKEMDLTSPAARSAGLPDSIMRDTASPVPPVVVAANPIAPAESELVPPPHDPPMEASVDSAHERRH